MPRERNGMGVRAWRIAPALVLRLLLLGNSGHLAAAPDPLRFQSIPVPDETPAHLCTALAQDHEGFLWIGTQAGLVRYDGYQFRVFKSDPNDPTSLGGSYVRSLFVSSDGRLWIGTFSNGLSVYDPQTESFRRYQHDAAGGPGLANDRVEAIAEDRDGRIWAGTYEGLDRIDPQSGAIVHFHHDPKDPSSLAAEQVRGLLLDRSGTLWVGSHDGLQVYLGDGRGFERRASEPGDPGSLAGTFVSKLQEDARGRIWVGTMENGAAVLDPRAPSIGALHRFAPQPGSSGLSHFWVYGFGEIPGAGTMWIATFGGGIDVVSLDTLQVTAHLRHDPLLAGTIGSDRLGAILVDRSGLVWVGTWGQGIDRHDPAARAFQTLRSVPGREEGLSHPEAVRALELRDGALWVGTNGNGIDVLDRAGRRVGGFRPAPKVRGALSDGSITCLAQGPDGAVWVATLDGTLHRKRTPQSGFERLTKNDGLAGGPIRAMTFGRDGTLWAGSSEGLTRIDSRIDFAGASKRPRIRAYRHSPSDPGTLSGQAVEAIVSGADGKLWVGTVNGLNQFDPATGRAVRIPYRPGARDGLPANWVPDLMLARDGRLWVATPGGAAILTSWDGKNARFEPVSARLGRAPAPVEALIEDDLGQVWLGARLRVDPKSWTYRELGPADGCDLHDFFIASRSRTARGELLFGSPGGLLVVRPERIAPWTYHPPLVATALRVDGVERAGSAVLRQLTLKPSERGFRLDFAALDFTAPARNLYRYRLEGYEERWTRAAGTQPTLAYNGLPPGHYRLQIRGTNRAGVWSTHEIDLPLTVLPAFYQTWWFRTLAALAALLLVYAAFRLRLQRLETRSRELEEQVWERTQSLEERGRELAVAYARIEEASLTDPLTQLRNRRYLEQTIPADLAIAARRHDVGDGDLVCLLLDLDHFKSVNDTYGHAAGDALLQQTADLLRTALRSSDHLVRWGGEEFLVVARFVDRRSAPELAEKIRRGLEEHDFVLPDGTKLKRTVSIGWALYPFATEQPQAVGWQEVVAFADWGLYEAKKGGRNRWVGVEIGEGAEAGEALSAFRDDSERAVAAGLLRVRVRESEDICRPSA